tara:strand:- start:538 stop:690 length:153 start_codon:yes stop_codon:yes gene_type:complete
MVILLNCKRMPRISAYLGISIHPGLNVSRPGKPDYYLPREERQKKRHITL